MRFITCVLLIIFVRAASVWGQYKYVQIGEDSDATSLLNRIRGLTNKVYNENHIRITSDTVPQTQDIILRKKEINLNIPSDITSNIPSDIPSVITSNIPSDIQSNVPSDSPPLSTRQCYVCDNCLDVTQKELKDCPDTSKSCVLFKLTSEVTHRVAFTKRGCALTSNEDCQLMQDYYKEYARNISLSTNERLVNSCRQCSENGCNVETVTPIPSVGGDSKTHHKTRNIWIYILIGVSVLIAFLILALGVVCCICKYCCSKNKKTKSNK